MADQQTLSVYDAKIDDYTKLTAAAPGKALRDFMAAVRLGGKVLDLGAGPGASAVAMAAAGFEAYAIDASPEMAAACAKHPGVNARCGDFWTISQDGPFDGIYANFALLHAKRDDFKTHIRDCHAALNPGGIFHIGTKLGEGAGRDALGRFYTYYGEDELQGILTDAGFTIDATHKGEEAGLAGSIDPFILIRAHA